MNELWLFNVSSIRWIWLSGTNGNGIFPDRIGGVGIPTARYSFAFWTSTKGELFIFSGYSGNMLLLGIICIFLISHYRSLSK